MRILARFRLSASDLARTSNTPGRTRSINFYEVRRAGQPRPEMLFADLPGYGYAKVSREISADWARFVDPYLYQRSTLALCLVLVDSNIPPQESDAQLMEFLASKERPYVIVATKSDRLSGNQLRQAMHNLGEAYPGVPIVAFSAKSGTGKDELWQHMRASLT
jgi:GTP-binding protein